MPKRRAGLVEVEVDANYRSCWFAAEKDGRRRDGAAAPAAAPATTATDTATTAATTAPLGRGVAAPLPTPPRSHHSRTAPHTHRTTPLLTRGRGFLMRVVLPQARIARASVLLIVALSRKRAPHPLPTPPRRFY